MVARPELRRQGVLGRLFVYRASLDSRDALRHTISVLADRLFAYVEFQMIKGLDVSKEQGAIDWAQVGAAGYRFVIVKCGNGNDEPDPTYAQNVNGARAAGLLVAAYHFVYPLPDDPAHPGRDPLDQAQAHYAASGGLVGSHFVDCEWPALADWAKWGCSAAQIRTWLVAYVNELTALIGRQPGVYSYPDWWDDIDGAFLLTFANNPLWEASYEPEAIKFPPWAAWSVWQYTDKLVVPGVADDVDGNWVASEA